MITTWQMVASDTTLFTHQLHSPINSTAPAHPDDHLVDGRQRRGERLEVRRLADPLPVLGHPEHLGRISPFTPALRLHYTCFTPALHLLLLSSSHPISVSQCFEHTQPPRVHSK